MKTEVQVQEAKFRVGEDLGGRVPMTFRFPDGTEKEFTAEPLKKDVAVACVLMEWVLSHDAAARAQWIAALQDAPTGSLNQLIRELLERRAQEEKTGKWPWKA